MPTNACPTHVGRGKGPQGISGCVMWTRNVSKDDTISSSFRRVVFGALSEVVVVLRGAQTKAHFVGNVTLSGRAVQAAWELLEPPDLDGRTLSRQYSHSVRAHAQECADCGRGDLALLPFGRKGQRRQRFLARS